MLEIVNAYYHYSKQMHTVIQLFLITKNLKYEFYLKHIQIINVKITREVQSNKIIFITLPD